MGNNLLLINNAIKKAKENFGNAEYFYFNFENDVEQILQPLNTINFLAPRKLIVIKNHKILESVDKNEFNFIDFIASLKEVNSIEVEVIFVHEGIANKQNPIIKFLIEKAKIINCDNVAPWKKEKLIFDMVKNYGGYISTMACKLLIEYFDNNFLQINQEIKKLLILNKKITEKNIEEMVDKNLNENVFALSNAIVIQDEFEIIKCYLERKDAGDEPSLLIGQVSSIFTSAMQVAELHQSGLDVSRIAQILKLNEFRIKKMQPLIRNMSLPKMEQLLADLATIDFKIKTMQLDKNIALDYWFLKFIRQIKN